MKSKKHFRGPFCRHFCKTGLNGYVYVYYDAIEVDDKIDDTFTNI